MVAAGVELSIDGVVKKTANSLPALHSKSLTLFCHLHFHRFKPTIPLLKQAV